MVAYVVKIDSTRITHKHIDLHLSANIDWENKSTRVTLCFETQLLAQSAAQVDVLAPFNKLRTWTCNANEPTA